MEGRGEGGYFFSLNYFFIVEWLRRGWQGFFLIYMLKGDGRGRGLIFFIVEREGVEVNVFFPLHLTCGRKRGRGLLFFFKLFFHC